jgi:hypothetical protein
LTRSAIRAAIFCGLLQLVAPAIACPPPVPGVPESPPPAKDELARIISRSSTDIVYGVVVEPSSDSFRFKVLHVYRGHLRKGQTIDVQSSWGFSYQPCPGMVGPPPLPAGAYGVIAYDGAPKLSFIPDDVLQQMFAAGLIVSAKATRSH